LSILEEVGSIPRDGDGPVFREPWEARAFALAVELNRNGHFTWTEWSHALGRRIASAGPCDGGDRYYERWLAALEDIMAERGITAR
jgi:nitrile hydratase accessory protein